MELEGKRLRKVDVSGGHIYDLPQSYCFGYVIRNIRDLSSQGLLCTPSFSLRMKRGMAGPALALCLVCGGLCSC